MDSAPGSLASKIGLLAQNDGNYNPAIPELSLFRRSSTTQQQLRLQEASQLMLNRQLDAGSAALQVGYESVSQFNRGYCRLFGAPPLRDIKRMQKDFKFDQLDGAVGLQA